MRRTHKVLISVLIGPLVLALAALLFFNVFNWNHARPLLEKVSRSLTPYEVLVKGDWRMHLGRNFELMLSDFTVRSEEYPSDAPPLFEAGRFFVRIPIQSFFEVRKVIDQIELAEARVHLLRDEQGNLLFLPPKGEVKPGRKKNEESPGKIRVPEINGMDVQDARFTFQDQGLKETASLNIDRIRSLAGAGFEPIHVRGKGRLQGQPFTLNATWEDTSGKNKGPFDLAVLMELGKNRLVAEGNVMMDQQKGGLDHADIMVQSDWQDPARIMRIIGIPSKKPVSFALTVKVTARPETWEVKKVRWDTARSSVSARATIDLKAPRPNVDALVEVPGFDLRDIDSFMPPPSRGAGGEGGKSAKPKGAPIFSRTPFNLERLYALDGKVVFDVRKVRGERALAMLQSVQGSVQLKNGDIAVALDNVALGNGHLKLNATLKPESSRDVTIKTQGQFRDVSLMAVAGPFAGKLEEKTAVPAGSVLGGDLSGDFGMHTTGHSVHDLAAHLDGAMTFALEDGQLNAVALDLLNLDIANAFKAWLAKQRGVKVPCVLAYLPIKDGVIRSEGLYANPATSEVLGDGYVDLGKEVYDIRLATKGDQPILSDVVFPIHIKGKFGGGKVDKSEGKDTKAETIKEALPHARQKSVQVEQAQTATGCTKELRERYLPATRAAVAH